MLSQTLHAGDIPGLPVIQPPSLQGDVQLQAGNDFFSVLNNRDDFRTQQFSLAGYVTDQWFIVIEQSILTARGPTREFTDPAGTEGRLDQISASLAYRTYLKQTNTDFDQVLIGAGIRSVGNFSGAQIQNGAHRLLKDSLINLPYVTTKRTDATLWLRASRQHYFMNSSVNSNWIQGYWLDGSALITSDDQSDGTIGLYGTLGYKGWELWTGLRGDWRTGYDRDVVQRLTAEHERGITFALGLSFGPVKLETIEGLGSNENSFGRLVLTATNVNAVNPDNNGSQFSYQFSILTPKIAVQTQFRWSESNWRIADIARYSVVIDHRYATPATNNVATQFNISSQLSVGVEAALTNLSSKDWIQPYLMLGAGNRSEFIEGQGKLLGIQSEKVNSGVIVSDFGVRFHLAGKTNSWLVQLQMGFTAWYPISKKDVIFNSKTETILKPDSSGMVGVNASFHY